MMSSYRQDASWHSCVLHSVYYLAFLFESCEISAPWKYNHFLKDYKYTNMSVKTFMFFGLSLQNSDSENLLSTVGLIQLRTQTQTLITISHKSAFNFFNNNGNYSVIQLCKKNIFLMKMEDELL